MSKLGLGVVAANSFFDAERAREANDYVQANRKSELSLLPDRENAVRSGYQLQDAQNRSGLDLVSPRNELERNKVELRNKETLGELGRVDAINANAEKRAGLESDRLDGERQRLPFEQAIENNKAQIESALSNTELQNLPRRIRDLKMKGVFSDVDAGATFMAKLADLREAGDPGQVVSFMNAMVEAGAAPEGKRVSSVKVIRDPKTGEDVFVAFGADGKNVMQIGVSQMNRVRDLVKPRGIEFKTVNAGDSLVRINGGRAEQVFQAPESLNSSGARQGPLERDVNYLVRQGMTRDQALAHLGSTKPVSRQQYILDRAKDLGRDPTQAEIRSYGDTYDRISGAGRGAPPGEQNRQSGEDWRGYFKAK